MNKNKIIFQKKKQVIILLTAAKTAEPFTIEE
jgi:hypothetical protein